MLVIRGGNCSIEMTAWDVKKRREEVEREREGKNRKWREKNVA